MAVENSIISEIKDRLNVADIIASYIPMKKSGTNFKAVCPFHSEKTASLMISPEKQIWHCFGCGEGGNVFSFVMKYENLEFPEALKILAERAGVQLPKFTKQDADQDRYRSRLEKINELAADFYAQVLTRSSQASAARQYLQQRGLSAQTVKEWQIGFAPDNYHALEAVLIKKGFKISELIDAGVSSKSGRGDVYDRFFNRITFPIANYAGGIVGFTARVLDPNAKAAKYVNSPQTLIYNKSKVVFTLYRAKQAIRKENCAIVVEGNMDAISCHQAGFKNAIASSGTAFTLDQLQILGRLTKNLKFAFDADSAGDAATKRALDLALRLGFSVFIIKIEGAKDPDEMIRKDRAAFERAVKSAPLYLDYFFEKEFAEFDPGSIQSKKDLFAVLLPLIAQLSDPLEKDHYVRKLAQKAFVPEKTILESLGRIKGASAGAGIAGRTGSEDANRGSHDAVKSADEIPIVKNKYYVLEQGILGYALFDAVYYEPVSAEIAPEDFKNQNFRKIYEYLLSERQKTDNFEVEKFLESFNNVFDKDGKMLRAMAQEARFVIESEYGNSEEKSYFQHDFKEMLNEFKLSRIKSRMTKIISDLASAENRKDKPAVLELNREFSELSRKLKGSGS